MGAAGSIDELSAEIFGGKLEIFLTIAEPMKDRKQTLDAVRTALENIPDIEKVIDGQTDASGRSEQMQYAAANSFEETAAAESRNSMILFTLECGSDVRPDVVSAVTAAGGRIFEISLHRHSLDALYKAYFRKLKDQEVVYESQN